MLVRGDVRARRNGRHTKIEDVGPAPPERGQACLFLRLPKRDPGQIHIAVGVAPGLKPTLQLVVDGSPRNLFHKGEDVYFPSGVPSVGFRFEIKDGKSTGFAFLNPEPVAMAKRVAE